MDLWSSATKAREVCGDENQFPRVENTDSSLDQLAFGKQLKSFRLLTQLLPDSNRQVLKDLLHILRQVFENEKCTRMTASALGTIFGPVFSPGMFDPSKSSSLAPTTAETACRERCQDAIQLATRLIEINDDLFPLPTSLVEDIYKNLNAEDPAKLLLTPRGKRLVPGDKEDSQNRSPPLQTSIRFATLCSPYEKRKVPAEPDTRSSRLPQPSSPHSDGAGDDGDVRSKKHGKKEPEVTARRVEKVFSAPRLGALREAF
ncbi:unnamed protein product [Dibothriocephalus latus]|uniref:Rho-GAP domain-containing protein n=1 Tax=Dibothriocephalus latus TaxID=60516 RepID=A0A3P7N657_DIBLA|nr:unnamed protein product [Dibothriocephalus latus]